MKKEKSCGAVVYVDKDGERLYFIEKMSQGHYSLPKGHVEGAETEEQTAKREIKEEMNIEVELDTSFRETISYSPKVGVIKDVVFFVAKACGTETKNQEIEVSQIFLLPFEKACEILTFKDDKNVLRKADDYLNK